MTITMATGVMMHSVFGMILSIEVGKHGIGRCGSVLFRPLAGGRLTVNILAACRRQPLT